MWILGLKGLTDTFVRGEIYLRPPSQKPVLALIRTVHFYISVGGRGLGHFQDLRVRFWFVFKLP